MPIQKVVYGIFKGLCFLFETDILSYNYVFCDFSAIFLVPFKCLCVSFVRRAPEIGEKQNENC